LQIPDRSLPEVASRLLFEDREIGKEVGSERDLLRDLRGFLLGGLKPRSLNHEM
jgi:hypothetical protein